MLRATSTRILPSRFSLRHSVVSVPGCSAAIRTASSPAASRTSSAWRTRPADFVREAAQTLAERVAAELPETLTTAWRKEKRDGRILVDVARNTYGQTLVAAYAVRALAGAPVSTPLTWDEVADPKLTAHAFTLKTTPARLAERGDPWADMSEHAATLPSGLTAS